jgi:hypothetical protein
MTSWMAIPLGRGTMVTVTPAPGRVDTGAFEPVLLGSASAWIRPSGTSPTTTIFANTRRPLGRTSYRRSSLTFIELRRMSATIP